jgi:hypothetical protein
VKLGLKEKGQQNSVLTSLSASEDEKERNVPKGSVKSGGAAKSSEFTN